MAITGRTSRSDGLKASVTRAIVAHHSQIGSLRHCANGCRRDDGRFDSCR